MNLPLNRVVAFAGPYISLTAGAVATAIIAKANALGIQGLEQDQTAQQIASAITFTLAAVLTWLGQSKWLRGHQLQLTGDAHVQAAALTAPPVPPAIPADPTIDELLELDEGLPSDEEEFADDPITLDDEDLEPAAAAAVDNPDDAR